MKVFVDANNCLVRFLKKSEMKSPSDTQIFCRINSNQERTDTVRVVQKNDINESIYDAMLILEHIKNIDQLSPSDQIQQKLYAVQHIKIYKYLIEKMIPGQEIKVISNGKFGPEFQILN
jgi:hypothetical protein